MTNQTNENGLEPRFSVQQIAKDYSVSVGFIYKQVRLGFLSKPEKWGRNSRWKKSDVVAWAEKFQKGLTNNEQATNASLSSRGLTN